MKRGPRTRWWPAVLAASVGVALMLGACRGAAPEPDTPPAAGAAGEEAAAMVPASDPAATDPAAAEDEALRARLRTRMVDVHIAAHGVKHEAILDAMRKIPRHVFVPARLKDSAYQDRPLPIGQGQTISQPYMVARMTELARAPGKKRALDVGTGSGYQAAVLAEVMDEVYSIEILCPLADEARERLKSLGHANVTVRCGDGYRGWPDKAPFDVIIVAAAPEAIPKPLIDQLAPGGRLVIPLGAQNEVQVLTVVERGEDGSVRQFEDGLVRFVPMTGEAQGR